MTNTLTKNQERWLEALESGDYEQDTGYLQTKDGYCCLGVACDISGIGEWQDPEYPSEVHSNFLENAGESTSSELGTAVLGWLGIRTHLGSFFDWDTKKQTSLATLNDSGKTFAEIAEYVRAHPDVVFRQKVPE